MEVYLSAFLSAAGGILVLLLVFFFCRSKAIGTGRKANSTGVGDRQKTVMGLIAEVLPVHPNSGWSLEATYSGVRLFTRQLDSLQKYSISKHVSAASLIVDITLKRGLSLVTSVRELPCWMFGLASTFSPPTLVDQSSTSHIIQFTVMQQPPAALLQRIAWNVKLKVASAIVKYTPFLEGLIRTPPRIRTETIERFWHCEQDGLCYMFSQPRLPSSLPYVWSCICFTPLRQPGISLATLVMCPTPGANVAPLITGQLCALREHITMRAFKVYSRYRPTPHLNPSKQVKGGKELVRGDVVAKESDDKSATTRQRGVSSRQVSQEEESVDVSASIPTSPSSPISSLDTPPTTSPAALSNGATPTAYQPPVLTAEEELDAKYLKMAKECTSKLVKMAGEGVQEGWLEVGLVKNIAVMKKLPRENEPPLNTVKGTGIVAAPPEFLLRVMLDPAHSTILDDLLKEMRLIRDISPAVSLVQLLYKGVWPTSPRDISLITVSGQVDATTWISSANSVVDDRIPPEKGYVRAELLGGGYVIHSVPGNPEASNVTYAACVDLKGSIPGFVAGKIAESQPMCVNRLKNLAVPLYEKLKADPQALSAYEEKFPIAQALPEEKQASTSSEPDQPPALLEDRLAQSQWHFDPTPTATASDPTSPAGEVSAGNSVDGPIRFKTPPMDSDQGDEGNEMEDSVSEVTAEQTSEPVNMEVVSSHTNTSQETSSSTPSAALQLSQYMPAPSSPEDTSFQSITRENIYYPRHDSGEVDYRTLANQTAARVLEEVFHVSGMDLLSPSTFQLTGGWTFAGLEKDVLLLSKNSPDQPFSSFMGKGIIPLSPQFVFDSLRNPQLRFMYDNMLKELHIVRHIEEGLFILHLHHETTQCFIRQARDFCILVSERSEPNKKMLTGFSIETPDCPPNPNLHRGKIHYSGWVVEPKLVQNKLCAEVTYLLQVDVGGVPAALVNMISKRQPLAVAYLRDYLVSTSLEHSGQMAE